MRWLMGLIARLQRCPVPPPVVPTQDEVQATLAATDPDYTRIRDLQHDLLQVVTARQIADGLAVRHERQFWERHRSD